MLLYWKQCRCQNVIGFIFVSMHLIINIYNIVVQRISWSSLLKFYELTTVNHSNYCVSFVLSKQSTINYELKKRIQHLFMRLSLFFFMNYCTTSSRRTFSFYVLKTSISLYFIIFLLLKRIKFLKQNNSINLLCLDLNKLISNYLESE